MAKVRFYGAYQKRDFRMTLTKNTRQSFNFYRVAYSGTGTVALNDAVGQPA